MNFLELYQKSITDELTAALVYIKMAESLNGFDGSKVAEHLKEHADQEYDHYKMLISGASKHGILKNFDISKVDQEVFDKAPLGDIMRIIMYTQNLESGAIMQYSALADFADEYDAKDTKDMFNTLRKAEEEHFDDFAEWTGQTRPCMIDHSIEVPMSSEDNKS